MADIVEIEQFDEPPDWRDGFKISMSVDAGKIIRRATREDPLSVETCFELLYLGTTNPNLLIRGIPGEAIEAVKVWLTSEMNDFEKNWQNALPTYKNFQDWFTTMNSYRHKVLVVAALLNNPHVVCNCPICELQRQPTDYYPRCGSN